MLTRAFNIWPLLFLTLVGEAGAQLGIEHRTIRVDQYRATYWTSEHGLPQNTVNCLLQSRDGYLWIGTKYGLARYDGARMVDCSAELSEGGNADLEIRSIAEDKRGRLWFLTGSGLVCRDEGRYHHFPLPENSIRGRAQTIHASRDGGLWVARADGFYHFHEGKASRRFGLGAQFMCGRVEDGEGIAGLLEDPQGNLWLKVAGLTRRHWERVVPSTGLNDPVTNLVGMVRPDLGGLWAGNPDRLWLARPGELLCWQKDRLTRHDAASAWRDWDVRQILEDSHGTVWIVTEGAVQLHRFAEGRFTSFGQREGLANAEDIRCLLADREGNIWLGTGSGGLYRLQPRPLVSLLSGPLSVRDEVYSVAAGKDGRVWLATTHALLKYEAGSFTVYSNRLGQMPSDQLLRVRPAFEHSSGEVFFGLDFHGPMTLRDGSYATVTCAEPLPGSGLRQYVTGYAEDGAGALWITTGRGLARWTGAGCRLWTTADGLSDNRTFGLACGSDGSIWVGTQTGGVNQVRVKEGRIRVYGKADGLLSQTAWPLRAEPDGSVWIGTPLGLNRIRNGEVRSVTLRNGLFDTLAYCLLEDRQGRYWTFGNRGIWRVGKADLHAVADRKADRVYCVSYGESDGMASAEGNGDQQPNAAALPNGELWFPTTRGVVVLDPARLRDNSTRPLVVVEEVLAGERTVYRDGGYTLAAGTRKEPRSPLRLPPGAGRLLEVRYTATTFVDSERTRFRYQLEGEDDGWREADTRRVALFTNLRPGDYRFRVMACNHDGYWSEAAAEFAFTLEPRFYQTWPFFVVFGLVAIGSAGGWHLRRLNALRHVQRLEQDRALQEERSRIAKDLHDDLGANLTGVSLQLEVARRQAHHPAALQLHLQSIAESVRALVENMREAVWSLNPRCDTLESCCGYICQYADTFLTSAGLRCRLDMPEELPARLLSAETRHHLLLVVKEALNNTAKHAAANEARLDVRLQDEWLRLEISDDGRGLGPGAVARRAEAPVGAVSETEERRTPVRSGGGLENMRRRIESLGGVFEVESAPGRGTRIRVRVPLPPRPQGRT